MSIFDDFLSGPEAQEACAAPHFMAAMLRSGEALALATRKVMSRRAAPRRLPKLAERRIPNEQQ